MIPVSLQASGQFNTFSASETRLFDNKLSRIEEIFSIWLIFFRSCFSLTFAFSLSQTKLFFALLCAVVCESITFPDHTIFNVSMQPLSKAIFTHSRLTKSGFCTNKFAAITSSLCKRAWFI